MSLIRVSGAQSLPTVNILHEVHAPAAATAATKTIVAVAERRHILHKVLWSYDADPTGGALSVTGSGKTLAISITKGGPGIFAPNYVCAVNTDLVVTLASGAGTVVGKIYFEYTTEQA